MSTRQCDSCAGRGKWEPGMSQFARLVTDGGVEGDVIKKEARKQSQQFGMRVSCRLDTGRNWGVCDLVEQTDLG